MSSDQSSLFESQRRSLASLPSSKYSAVANYTLARRDPAFKLRKRANPQSLSYEGDSLWTGPIYVGTPPQEFRVYYDTASSDLSLASTTCLDASCSGKARYDWEASATANATTFTVESNWVEGDTGNGSVWVCSECERFDSSPRSRVVTQSPHS